MMTSSITRAPNKKSFSKKTILKKKINSLEVMVLSVFKLVSGDGVLQG